MFKEIKEIIKSFFDNVILPIVGFIVVFGLFGVWIMGIHFIWKMVN